MAEDFLSLLEIREDGFGVTPFSASSSFPSFCFSPSEAIFFYEVINTV